VSVSVSVCLSLSVLSRSLATNTAVESVYWCAKTASHLPNIEFK